MAPYEKVSLIYDNVLSHVDYGQWCQYLLEIKNIHQKKGVDYMDVASGTGTFVHELSKVGLHGFGVELSDGMRYVAEMKYPNLSFVKGDMCCYCHTSPVDLVTCLLDSVNYLQGLGDITKLCNNVYSNLREDGIFIFDVVSTKLCKTYFDNYLEKDDYGGISYERVGSYDEKAKVQRSSFSLKIGEDVFEEQHEQYIYSIDEIKKAIRDSKMSFVVAYSDFSFRLAKSDTERIHFVLKKGN